MKDLTKYFIDLSKCSEEQQKHIFSLLPEPKNVIEYDVLFEGGEEDKENIYEVNFDGYVKAQFKIVDDKIEIIQAMNGYGNSIPVSEITITNSNQ